jgi:putative ABC transport system substrate-binding protein
MAPTSENSADRQRCDVERILNGAQAGELPFQGPTHLDFAINMRIAKALGLTIPPSLLVGADEVIE